MPVCLRCGTGYEVTERVCPRCGALPESTPERCGPVAMLAMRIAWGAAFVAAIICLLGGVIEAIRGEWFIAALLIFIRRQWVTASMWPSAWRSDMHRERPNHVLQPTVVHSMHADEIHRSKTPLAIRHAEFSEDSPVFVDRHTEP